MMAWIKTVVVEVVRCGDEDSGCNLKVDLTGYANGLHIECDRRHIVKNDFKTFVLNKIEEWSCHLLKWGQTGEEPGLWVNVTKRKFVCRSKQNIRIWKGLLKGQARRMGILHAQNPQILGWFSEKSLGKIWDEGCRVCDFLLIGWWRDTRAVLWECCAQSEVTILQLGGGLSSPPTQKNDKDNVRNTTWEGNRTML